MHGLMGAHACVGQYWMSDIFLSFPTHSFETGSLLERKLSDWLELLASEPWERQSLPYSTDYRRAPKPPLFMWVLRTETKKVNSKPFSETSP